MDKKYQSTIELKKSIKRYLVTMLCAVPLLILIGVFLEGKVNKALRIFIFVLVLSVVFVVEEFVYSKIKQKQQDKLEVKHKDVFK